MASFEKILVVQAGTIGEFVLSLAAMRRIRAAHPRARITLLTIPAFEALAKTSPYFNEVDTNGAPGNPGEWLALRKAIKAAKYLRVYDLQGNSASASLFKPIEDPCLPKGLKLPPTSPLMPAFVGTGSFSECLESLQPLLDTTAPCPPPSSHCLFAGLPTPHIDFEREDQRGFIGISEYWYTAQQVLGLGGVWDWAEWEKG
ncbi:MAG: hypothetical protein EON95_20910, partial [Caulobacteraceae bacterium]